MKGAAVRQTVRVVLGDSAIPVGTLTLNKDGARQSTAFAYDHDWLSADNRFEISPDLPLVEGHQFRRAPSREDSIFHFAFADTEPDGWGCRVIARDHAKQRRAARLNGEAPPSAALTEMDYLLGVDDLSRVGALRLTDANGRFLRPQAPRGRSTPPLIELAQLIGASRAVELNQETEADLQYLRGRGTSLGGMRPKCTLLDQDGHLAIGKFPSVQDERCVTRGEVLALRLAVDAGMTAAHARIVMSDDVPVALVRRFDRAPSGGRIPYLSAASMLQASRTADHAYTEIADVIVARCVEPKRDLEELWRRLVFNLLITNVDDHLQNHGFLHVEHGQWQLAPAFDLNPFPDKDPELKLWINETDGPVDSIDAIMHEASHFRLSDSSAKRILRQVTSALANWRRVAQSADIGMRAADLEAFAPAFENAQMQRALAWV
ncbi:type II toxin-antitoxin system HipA family toxin [Caballeronia sp. LZ034LL]|uniref:type II toxin-antitoxin system HipA family toxin n=1 Tax=Caballeronia sp. LZ034LL TaxID=3038567 RepID=UPI00285B84DC|nr:type II toxin-antitoxin system HipA family toxin [Caballeronia sp. LZ034LL]MDR5836739.1 type II toxin-antitoxin system HipA family toxin [Caballeronia sp. LZ034LL]